MLSESVLRQQTYFTVGPNGGTEAGSVAAEKRTMDWRPLWYSGGTVLFCTWSGYSGCKIVRRRKPTPTDSHKCGLTHTHAYAITFKYIFCITYEFILILNMYVNLNMSAYNLYNLQERKQQVGHE